MTLTEVRQLRLRPLMMNSIPKLMQNKNRLIYPFGVLALVVIIAGAIVGYGAYKLASSRSSAEAPSKLEENLNPYS